MHRSESWRCGLVDQHLGRAASSNIERDIGGSGAQAHRTEKDKSEMTHGANSATTVHQE